MSFENFDLDPALMKAINDLGFVDPTPIQIEAIPEIISGDKDFIGLAQTGTGKTAAFGLPMAQRIDFRSNHVQGLILCPTRELCVQIANDINSFCKYLPSARIVAVYGGASMENQRRQIKGGAHIVVATPGRLLDFIRRKVMDLSKVAYLVLDEADEMLNMGFQEDINAILDQTPKDKRIWLFSATMPKEVSVIAKKYMHAPREVTIGRKNSGAENIKHIYFVVKEKNRYQALKRIIDFHPDIYGLVFCRTRKETQEIAEKLIKDGYNAESLHGDLSQQVRDQVMRRYREKAIQVLIATDVAARGIDVQDISHVINYKLPDEADNYTHRSGRTGRAGKSGMSVSIINTKETGKLRSIEHKSGIQFTYMMVPEGRAVCENQLYAMVNKLVTVDVNHAEIGKFLPPVYHTLKDLTKEDLIQRFVSLEFNRFLTYYRDSTDINESGARKDIGKKKESPENRKFPESVRRFFMNAGHMDRIDKGAVIRTICEKSGIRAAKIGKVEILREFSFVEIETGVADKVLKAMKGAKIDGKAISIQYAETKPSAKNKKMRKKK
ncbi:MAG: DEAD/DEAH box helicase [Desulfobacteraceae bacterium]|nr:MAG: DEAD/DEAH box helicase [Desulfobacteraceae bacterium]